MAQGAWPAVVVSLGGPTLRGSGCPVPEEGLRQWEALAVEEWSCDAQGGPLGILHLNSLKERMERQSCFDLEEDGSPLLLQLHFSLASS